MEDDAIILEKALHRKEIDRYDIDPAKVEKLNSGQAIDTLVPVSSTRFIELAGEVNSAMPYFVVHRVMEALNERKKALKGAKVLALADCILIATNHDPYDYPFILEHAPLIVDTRNVFPDPAICCGKVFPA